LCWKDALKAAADVLKESAKTLRSRLNDSKPSTAEARQVFDAIRRLANLADVDGCDEGTADDAAQCVRNGTRARGVSAPDPMSCAKSRKQHAR
jgi:hypothetical protein